jgi:hypothetical protein
LIISIFYQASARSAIGIQEPSQYLSLRDQARLHGDNARIYFIQSQAAYRTSDGAGAKELSQLGKLELEQKQLKLIKAQDEIFKGR